MIRILICCAGGFSSSAMSVKVKKEIEKQTAMNVIKVDLVAKGIYMEE